MAVAVSVILAGDNIHIADVEATADGDTIATIPHGLGATPLQVDIAGLLAEARISLWVATTIDSTNVIITKTTDANSGVSGDQVRVTIALPHSLPR